MVLRAVAFGVALAPVVAVAGVAGRRVGSRIAALALLTVATLAVAGVVVRGLTGPLPVAAVVVATYAATGVALYASADRVAVAGWLLVASGSRGRLWTARRRGGGRPVLTRRV